MQKITCHTLQQTVDGEYLVSTTTYDVWINPTHIVSIAPLTFDGAPDIDEVTMVNNQVFYTLHYR